MLDIKAMLDNIMPSKIKSVYNGLFLSFFGLLLDARILCSHWKREDSHVTIVNVLF